MTLKTLQDALKYTYPDDLVNVYTDELTSHIDKHAPLRTKTIILRPSCPWFNEEQHDAKHLKRKMERQWRNTKLTVNHEVYGEQCAKSNKLLKQARVRYYPDKVESFGNDQKSIFKITKHLLGASKDIILSSNDSSKKLAQDFSDFFINKIEMIISDISSSESVQELVPSDDLLTEFTPATPREVEQMILLSPNKYCELDPIPTWLLKSCLAELLPVLTKIINSSLHSA